MKNFTIKVCEVGTDNAETLRFTEEQVNEVVVALSQSVSVAEPPEAVTRLFGALCGIEP